MKSVVYPVVLSLITASLAVGLGGCTTNSGAKKGPNGRPLYYIRTGQPGKEYGRASELCPNGYDVVSTNQTGLVVNLTVECK